MEVRFFLPYPMAHIVTLPFIFMTGMWEILDRWSFLLVAYLDFNSGQWLMLSNLREEGNPDLGSNPSLGQSSNSSVSKEEGNISGKDISFGQFTKTSDFRKEGKKSLHVSSLEQHLNERFFRVEMCWSPFPFNRIISVRLVIVKDTSKGGSNFFFSKVLTILSPPICKSDKK